MSELLWFRPIVLVLVMVVLLISFCGCKQRYLTGSLPLKQNRFKFAVCTQTRRPVHLEYWLHYYLEVLRVDKIYLKIENTPGLKEKLSKSVFADKLIVEEQNQVSNRDTYDRMQQRQCEWVNTSILYARDHHIDFLLHVDDDELLILSNMYPSLPDFLGKHKFLEYSNIHLQNAEAVYGEARVHEQDCFLEPKTMNPCASSGTCRSYANGKSIGNLRFPQIACSGPHAFTGRTLEVSLDVAFILHFDSCTFAKWFDKFSNLSNISNEVYEKIPFLFYKNSIQRLQDCTSINEECKSKVYPFYADAMTNIPEHSRTVKEMNMENVLTHRSRDR